MTGFIDGVQRRPTSAMSTVTAAMALPRRQSVVLALPNRLSSIDGLVRRVAAVPELPPPPIAMVAMATMPIAKPLTPSSAWYLPAALAAVTVSIAAGSIALEAGHLPALNLAAALPRAAVASHASAPLQPRTVATVSSPASKAASLAATQQAMQAVINQQAAAAGVPTGIMTIDLKTGAVASNNADTVFTSASIYKLFVADAVYHGIDAGTIHYTDLAGDTGMNVQDCLTAMITVSSNPCGEALGSMVGWDSQNATLHATGFTHTLLRQYASEQTSASDVALLLQKLYSGSLVSSASSTAFINLLKAQQINDRLPVGLPAGVTVAHKTGDLNGLAHDAGIVYTPSGNYIVVALTGPWDTTGQAYSWFASFSDSLYSALAKAHATPLH
jgi:beta-lactamase class A